MGFLVVLVEVEVGMFTRDIGGGGGGFGSRGGGGEKK